MGIGLEFGSQTPALSEFFFFFFFLNQMISNNLNISNSGTIS